MGNLSRKITRKKKQAAKSQLVQKKRHALLTQARSLNRAHRLEQSAAAYEQVLRIANPDKYIVAELFEVYLRAKEYAKGHELIETHLQSRHVLEYHLARGKLFCQQQRFADAIHTLRNIVDRGKDNPLFWSLLGEAFRESGEPEKGIDSLQKALALQPAYFRACNSLCAIYRKEGRHEQLRAQLRHMESLLPDITDPDERIQFLFLFGSLYDYLDEYDKAFFFLQKGNSLQAARMRHDPERDKQLFLHVRQNVTKELLAEIPARENTDPVPVFILGMPRSGTSLVEQILSCHDSVCALGELPFFMGLALGFDFTLPAASARKLADGYLAEIRKLCPPGRSFTDKLPHNFLHAGLIKAALPGSRIIHCVRDPMDTCFSCFKQHFTGAFGFSYDLVTLGHYYLQYADHMNHWEKIMPGDMLHVQYERLVRDPEREIARLLDYCNLPWQRKCLRFYESKRIIDTASREQVSQPLYISSIHRWRKYEQHLQPLLDILGENGTGQP